MTKKQLLRAASGLSANATSGRMLAGAVLALGAVAGGAAHANPVGEQVAAGSASFNRPNASTLIVNQATDKAVINWQGFDILNGELTQFVQPSAASIALNRIQSGNPTQILGTLTANGQLMIVNPSGIMFGKTANVDVGGLVASTADIANQDFMNGRFVFSKAGNADASIINKGTITAAEGGLVALVAPGVQNEGVIQANLGTVAIGAAETFTIDFYGDNLISFSLGQEAASKAKDENGDELSAAIENSGTISAKGGRVLLTAKAAKGVVDQAINTSGIVEATSLHQVGGSIVLDGGQGAVHVSGLVDASGEKGGKIDITGHDVTVANGATIDASGATGGGKVRIGGDFHGQGELPLAQNVTVEQGAVIDVSATDNGNGGQAALWAEGANSFEGTIYARGGSNGGNGGLRGSIRPSRSELCRLG